MIPELEILYKQAINAENLTRWLGNKDFIKEYEDSVQFSRMDLNRLQTVLTDENLKIFQRYIDNKECQIDAEFRMVFSEGVSIGLRLGSLCAWG